MKKIKLIHGGTAIIDDVDYQNVKDIRWYADKHRNKHYATGCLHSKHIRMHQIIMGKKEGFEIDHINGDGLDNRRSNLRFVTHSQNLMNFKSKRIFRGVYWSEEKKKWRVYICLNYKTTFCGYFKDKNQAALAYNKKAIELFGEFATLNTIKSSND